MGKKGERACSPRETVGRTAPQKLLPEGLPKLLCVVHKPIQEPRPGEAPLVSQGDGAAETLMQAEGVGVMVNEEHPLCLSITAHAAQNPQKEPYNLVSDSLEATRERN